MTIDSFDFKSLQTRIDSIKEEGKENTDFTHEFIECLMSRYNLTECIPSDHELEYIPDVIFERITQGEIPTKEELLLMDVDAQNYLLFELIYFCGMGMIASFDYQNQKEEGQDENETPIFDAILSMREISPAHYLGSYITAAMTILMGCIPSPAMIQLLTDDFSLDEAQLQQNFTTFSEIAASILIKYREECEYWIDIDSDNE